MKSHLTMYFSYNHRIQKLGAVSAIHNIAKYQYAQDL